MKMTSVCNKENDLNIINCDEKQGIDFKVKDDAVQRDNSDGEKDNVKNNEETFDEDNALNNGEQSYEDENNQSRIISDEEELEDCESEEDDSPDCPEIQKISEDEQEVGDLFEYYSKELLLVDESPEERKEIDENPDRPLFAMRNTSSANIMRGLLAKWIKEVKGMEMSNPDKLFRKLLPLTLCAFRDDHWIYENEGKMDTDVIHFFIKEIGDLWFKLFTKTDSDLRITNALRNEIRTLFAYYKNVLRDLTQEWPRPIEFSYTKVNTKYRVKKQNYDDLIAFGESAKEAKIKNDRRIKETEKDIEHDKEKNVEDATESKLKDEPVAKKTK